MHQDRNGFVWLGTRAGLCRFDGCNYKILRHQAGNPHSLLNHHIRSIHEDRSGKLWLATFGAGLSCLDPTRMKIENFPLQSAAGRVHDICSDQNGNLWLATEGGGLVQFLSRERRYVSITFPKPDQEAFRNLRCISKAKDGSLWVGGTMGILIRFFPESKTYRRMPDIPATTIWEIISLSDSLLALATIDGLMAINLHSGKVRMLADIYSAHPLPGNTILAMCRDSFGYLWLATTKGLGIYDPKTGKTESNRPAQLVQHSLPDERLISLMQDRHGLMWIGTWNEGFTHTPVQPSGFNLVETPPGSTGSASLEQVQKICWDHNGKIQASTWQDRAEVDPESNSLRKIGGDSGRAGNIPSGRLWGIFSDSRKRLWVGTHYQGIYCREKEDGPFMKMDTLPGFSSRLRFCSEITEDCNGRIWVGSFGEGLAEWDERKNRFRFYRFKNNAGELIPALNQLNCIRPGPDGNLWLGTNGGGLLIFNPESKQYRHIPPDPDKGGSFNGFVLGIAFTTNALWLTTEGGGVLYSSLLKPQKFISLNQQIGLAEQNLPAIQTDTEGNLWLGGNGLYLIEIAGRKATEISSYKTFRSESLMPSMRWQSAALSRDGRLAIGGNRGILFFHPKQLHLPPAPEVVLAGIFVGEKEMSNEFLLHEQTSIRIPAETDFFSLQLANPIFYGQDRSTCFYQLKGLHPELQAVMPGGKVDFSGLAPGLHPLHIFTRNEAGLQSQTKTIVIEKLPYWWQTIWSRMLFLLLFFALLFALIRWRFRVIRQQEAFKARNEKEKLELEVKALRAQMNPHFMFNALNSIDHFIWKNEVTRASDYLSRFSRLMRLVLEQSRQEYIQVNEELDSLRLYIELEQMRMDQRFEAEITEEDIPEGTLFPPMLLQPLVENAIIHGLRPMQLPGRLHIKLSAKKSSQLLISVEDNGIGRKPDSAGQDHSHSQGLGLRITRERIFKLNSGREDCFYITDLKDADGNACGTRIDFTIPLNETETTSA
jgi:ligand-binding sensor domain-containing protein